MILRRMFSKTVREAVAMRKHVMRLLNAQCDLMKPEARGAVQAKISELDEAVASRANDGKVRIKTEELQFAAEKWIKAYPNPVWRENVEVLLVAIAVAMGIRTFFLQPFKIPTGSMQPTLYGVTSTPDYSRVTSEIITVEQQKMMMSDAERSAAQAKISADADAEAKAGNAIVIPPLWQRLKDWVHGVSYVHVVAPADGTVKVGPMHKLLIFNISQTLSVGGVSQTIWFPPDFGDTPLDVRAGLQIAEASGRIYHKGEDVVKMRTHAGDHLFVNRLTYNFSKPKRGDIIVFSTRGIDPEQRQMWRIPANDFYIKRLCGLGGETIALQKDYDVTDVPQPGVGTATIPAGHLVVNGRPLSAATPHFENLYSFSGASTRTNVIPYVENHYFGHAQILRLGPGQEYQVQPDHLFVMGDNTMNSLDSRFWGDFPARSVIGKSFFVYWPISSRFGLSNP